MGYSEGFKSEGEESRKEVDADAGGAGIGV